MKAVVVPAGEAPVAGDGLAELQRDGDRGMNGLVALDHPRHVHHLPEPGGTLPAERLANIFRAERRAGILEAGQRRYARRHREKDLQRQPSPLLEHPAHPLEAEDVRHLVVADVRTVEAGAVLLSASPSRPHRRYLVSAEPARRLSASWG